MLSIFGKAVRKLRIDRGDSLKAMAQALDKTSAYISAVETGKKNATDSLVRGIAEYYALTPEQTEALKLAAVESRSEIVIAKDGLNDLQRKVAASLAIRFSSLTDEELNQILKLLNQK